MKSEGEKEIELRESTVKFRNEFARYNPQGFLNYIADILDAKVSLGELQSHMNDERDVTFRFPVQTDLKKLQLPGTYSVKLHYPPWVICNQPASTYITESITYCGINPDIFKEGRKPDKSNDLSLHVVEQGGEGSIIKFFNLSLDEIRRSPVTMSFPGIAGRPRIVTKLLNFGERDYGGEWEIATGEKIVWYKYDGSFLEFRKGRALDYMDKKSHIRAHMPFVDYHPLDGSIAFFPR